MIDMKIEEVIAQKNAISAVEFAMEILIGMKILIIEHISA